MAKPAEPDRTVDEVNEREYGDEEESMKSGKRKKKKSKKKRLAVRVEAVTESADRAAPLVGYFPSGYDPQKRGDEGEEPDVRVFRNPRRPGRLELVVRPRMGDGSASNVEFVGTSYTGEAAKPQVCTYALGILDKEKQSLRIVPIAANKVAFPFPLTHQK